MCFMRMIIVLAIGFWPMLATAQPKLSISEFRDVVVSEIRETYPDWRVSPKGVDAIEYFKTKQTSAGEKPYTFFVNRVHEEYKRNPQAIETQLVQMVSALDVQMPDYEEFADRIVLLLRPEEIASTEFADSTNILSAPFQGDLIAAFFLDYPEALAWFPASKLQEMDLSLDEITSIAKANTAKRIGDVSVGHYEGVEIVTSDSGLVAGIPLIDDTCAAGTPNNAWWLADRNTLIRTEFIGGLKELDPRLELMMFTVADAVAADSAYSKYLFLCLDGKIQIMLPGASRNE